MLGCIRNQKHTISIILSLSTVFFDLKNSVDFDSEFGEVRFHRNMAFNFLKRN